MASLYSPEAPTVEANLDILYARRNVLQKAIANLERYAELTPKKVQSAGKVVAIENRKAG